MRNAGTGTGGLHLDGVGAGRPGCVRARPPEGFTVRRPARGVFVPGGVEQAQPHALVGALGRFNERVALRVRSTA
nr:hypothetical protein KitaXyl93_77060 [Kitasatospora sp. Xyl93]